MKAILFGTRTRVAVTTAVTALAVSGAAIAAIIIYSGLSGSLGGAVAGSSTVGALTFSPATASIPIPGPGGTGSLNWTVSNADPTNAQTIESISDTITTSDPTHCPASDFTANLGALVGASYPAGASNVADSLTAGLTASSSMPSACAGDTITVTVTGTTQAA